MVLLPGVIPAGAGVGIGLLSAPGASRLIEIQLHQTAPRDDLTYSAVAIVTIAVVLVSTWMSARRAARVAIIV